MDLVRQGEEVACILQRDNNTSRYWENWILRHGIRDVPSYPEALFSIPSFMYLLTILDNSNATDSCVERAQIEEHAINLSWESTTACTGIAENPFLSDCTSIPDFPFESATRLPRRHNMEASS